MDIRTGPGPLGRKVERSELDTDLEKLLGYIGGDLTVGSITGTTTETTIGSVTIPANTVTGGIVVIVMGRGNLDQTNGLTLRIKIGAAASEATKETLIMNKPETTGEKKESIFLHCYETAQTWTNEISVIVTGENSSVSGTLVSYCESIIVLGY